MTKEDQYDRKEEKNDNIGTDKPGDRPTIQRLGVRKGRKKQTKGSIDKCSRWVKPEEKEDKVKECARSVREEEQTSVQK